MTDTTDGATYDAQPTTADLRRLCLALDWEWRDTHGYDPHLSAVRFHTHNMRWEGDAVAVLEAWMRLTEAADGMVGLKASTLDGWEVRLTYREWAFVSFGDQLWVAVVRAVNRWLDHVERYGTEESYSDALRRLGETPEYEAEDMSESVATDLQLDTSDDEWVKGPVYEDRGDDD